MGYRHDRDEILAVGVQLVREEGLAALTFGRVARRLGIADRTIVYYFPWKATLVEAVIRVVGEEAVAFLDARVGSDRVSRPGLQAAVWEAMGDPEADDLFGVHLQLAAMGAAGAEPYAGLADRLVARWIEWVGERLDDESDDRIAAAEAVVSTIVGLMFLRASAGATSAERAAEVLLDPGRAAPRR